MTVEKSARIGQLELCCQHVSVDIEILRKTAQNPQAPKKVPRGRRRRIFSQITRTTSVRPDAKDEKHHSVQLVETTDDIHGRR